MLTGMIYFFVQFFLNISVVDQDPASTVSNHAIRKAYAFEVLLAGTVIILQSFLKAKTEYKIILMLNLFDNFLSSNISHKLDNGKFQKMFAIKFFIMFAIFAFLYGMILYLSYPRDSDIIFASILLQMCVIKFVFHVDLVRFRLQKLSEILRNDLKREVSFEDFINNLLQENPLPNDYSRVKHNISVIQRGFSILADTAALIDDCYGWIMLILFVIVFCGRVFRSLKHIENCLSKLSQLNFPGITYSAYVFFLLLELRRERNAIIRKLIESNYPKFQ